MLTAERIADVLVQTGRLGPEDAETLRREARGQPRRHGTGRASEQRSHAYELVERMQFRDAARDRALT